jgi:hypothetical protein
MAGTLRKVRRTLTDAQELPEFDFFNCHNPVLPAVTPAEANVTWVFATSRLTAKHHDAGTCTQTILLCLITTEHGTKHLKLTLHRYEV